MKTLALACSLVGLLTLLFLFLFSNPINISSNIQLQEQQENQKVVISGYVIKEIYQTKDKLLLLDNQIKVQCNNPCPDYLYKNITVQGIYDNFIEPRVIANKITLNP